MMIRKDAGWLDPAPAVGGKAQRSSARTSTRSRSCTASPEAGERPHTPGLQPHVRTWGGRRCLDARDYRVFAIQHG